MNSYWEKNTKKTNFSELENEEQCDVCVIGGGITGIATAYMLVKHGLKVIILEKDKICMGVTAGTTAKITSQHNLFYKYLIDNFSEDFAKKYLEANENAIKTIKNIIDENNIECDFEFQDAYVYTNLQDEVQKIEDEVKALKKIGYNAEFLKKTPLPFDVLAAIKFPNQAQFHVRKYVLSLVDIILNLNAKIYENSKVIDIEKEGQEYEVITKNR